MNFVAWNETKASIFQCDLFICYFFIVVQVQLSPFLLHHARPHQLLQVQCNLECWEQKVYYSLEKIKEEIFKGLKELNSIFSFIP